MYIAFAILATRIMDHSEIVSLAAEVAMYRVSTHT